MPRFLFLCVALVVLPLFPALAQDAPTGEEAEKVIDYYYNGSGAVLAKLQICGDVPSSGDNQYACVDEVSPSNVVVGETYDLRMVYLVPRDESIESIFVQYNRGGITRSTDDVSVSGSLRYRTWKTFSLDTAGSWTIKVLLDDGGDVRSLGELNVTVSDAG